MSKQSESNKTLKNLGLAMGAAAAMGLSGAASADQNPFAVEAMESGYMQVAMMEGKCGEGKCGNMMKKKGEEAAGKKMEGKCGNMMKKEGEKKMEGKCGNMMKGKKKGMEGKCGEGKCGNMK